MDMFRLCFVNNICSVAVVVLINILIYPVGKFWWVWLFRCMQPLVIFWIYYMTVTDISVPLTFTFPANEMAFMDIYLNFQSRRFWLFNRFIFATRLIYLDQEVVRIRRSHEIELLVDDVCYFLWVRLPSLSMYDCPHENFIFCCPLRLLIFYSMFLKTCK